MIKRNIFLLWAIALLQGMVFYAPVATLYRQAAGLGIFSVTLIESISLGLTICLEVPWGWAADRIGYRRTMLLCCGLYFVSKLLFWQAEGFGGFLLERILLSVVCAGLSGVDSSMLYLSCSPGTSHRAFSIYEGLGELGLLLAALVQGFFIGEDYRLAGFLTAVSYGIAAALSLGLKEVHPGTRSRDAVSGRQLAALVKGQLGNRRVMYLLLAAAMLEQTHQAVTVFLNQLQYLRAGMSHRAISLAYILVSLGSLAGAFSGGVCARLGRRRMGMALLGMAASSCLLLGLVPSAALSVTAVLVLRLSFSLFQPLHTDLQNQLVTARDRATALSMNAVVMDGTGIFLNLVFGSLAERCLEGAMLFGGALCALALVLWHRAFPETSWDRHSCGAPRGESPR